MKLAYIRAAKEACLQVHRICPLGSSNRNNSTAGNCQEMAAVAFLYLLEQGVFPIEMVSIPHHTFVVIGRDPSTPIDEPSQWNADTIVCDPWRREYIDRQPHLFKQEAMVYPPNELYHYGYQDIAVGFGLYQNPMAEQIGTVYDNTTHPCQNII